MISSAVKAFDQILSPPLRAVMWKAIALQLGFDYTSLHWADKQKPLAEVADPMAGFPDVVGSPPPVPEAPDAPQEVAPPAQIRTRIVIGEHFLRVVPADAAREDFDIAA